MIPRILIVSDDTDKRAKELAIRLGRLGAAVTAAPLAAIAFDTRLPTGISIPGLNGALPDGVLVRSISAGSFEAVTRRLGVLHAFDRLGVPVWNCAQAIERCVDKSTTTFLLRNAGLPTPATFAVEGLAEAEVVARRELPNGPLVLKPLFGSQGQGIRLIRTLADLPPAEEVSDVYYLQRYVPRPGPPYRDFRVFVCEGKVVAMMSRSSADWITNVNRGGMPESVDLASEAELAGLAIAASSAVGTAFSGVDIVQADDGKLFVLEVNSMPAWSGLQSVASVDITGAIADALMAFVADRARASATPLPYRLVAPANS